MEKSFSLPSKHFFFNLAPKNQPSSPTTPGSKRKPYVRKFGRSTKANAPAKCRKARKAAKQEAINEQNRRNAMSVIEQQQEKEAQAAAELEHKARASDRSKRINKMMAARAKKFKLERRLYLQKLRKARIAKMNRNTDTLWKTNGAEYVQWYLQSFELTSKPVHFMTVPKMLEPLDCKCLKKTQYVDLYMNHCKYLILDLIYYGIQLIDHHQGTSESPLSTVNAVA